MKEQVFQVAWRRCQQLEVGQGHVEFGEVQGQHVHARNGSQSRCTCYEHEKTGLQSYGVHLSYHRRALVVMGGEHEGHEEEKRSM